MIDRPRFAFVVEALPSDRDPAIRLRLALRYMLRTQALRCVEVAEVKAATPDAGRTAERHERA